MYLYNCGSMTVIERATSRWKCELLFHNAPTGSCICQTCIYVICAMFDLLPWLAITQVSGML